MYTSLVLVLEARGDEQPMAARVLLHHTKQICCNTQSVVYSRYKSEVVTWTMPRMVDFCRHFEEVDLKQTNLLDHGCPKQLVQSGSSAARSCPALRT